MALSVLAAVASESWLFHASSLLRPVGLCFPPVPPPATTTLILALVIVIKALTDRSTDGRCATSDVKFPQLPYLYELYFERNILTHLSHLPPVATDASFRTFNYA